MQVPKVGSLSNPRPYNDKRKTWNILAINTDTNGQSWLKLTHTDIKNGKVISQYTWKVRVGPKRACQAGGLAYRSSQFVSKSWAIWPFKPVRKHQQLWLSPFCLLRLIAHTTHHLCLTISISCFQRKAAVLILYIFLYCLSNYSLSSKNSSGSHCHKKQLIWWFWSGEISDLMKQQCNSNFEKMHFETAL